VYRCFLAQSLFTALTTDLHTVNPNHVHLTQSLSSSTVIINKTCRGRSHHALQNPSRGCTNSLQGLVNPNYHPLSDQNRLGGVPSNLISSLPSQLDVSTSLNMDPDLSHHLILYRSLYPAKSKTDDHSRTPLEINFNWIIHHIQDQTRAQTEFSIPSSP
jgi:hypothetical protein